MRHVLNEVSTLKAKYYQLGLAVGVPPSELDAVRSTYNQDKSQALAEVLHTWLRGVGELPTWQNLVKAIDSPACGPDHALAKEIASRHLLQKASICKFYANPA